MNFLLVHPLTLEALAPEEAQVLRRLCTPAGPATDLPEEACQSLVRKSLVTGKNTNAWEPTVLGRMAFRRSHPIGRNSGGETAELTEERIHGVEGAPWSPGIFIGERASSLEQDQDWVRLQEARRENLMDVLTDLRTSDIDALKAQAKMLGVPAAALRRALASGTLSDAHAREIEWAVNKPRGWMDSGHRGEPE